MTNWRVEVSVEALLDLRGIEQHLEESHLDFGESPGTAIERAQRRSDAILERAMRLPETPHIGQRVPQFGAGMRRVTLDRAVYYFTTERLPETVSVVAIFLSGQDHQARMLARGLSRM